MTQQIINVGSAINDGTGDPARTAFTKSNDNFTELYARGILTAPQGRLTLQTAVAVMTTTQSAKTTIYYTPYVGNRVPIYDGTNMVMTTFAELSVATTDTTKSPAAIGASKVNDWFVWNDSGTVRIGHGPDWTSDTARSAGTALTTVNGILLNNASITNGPAASRGTYVGTTRSNASSQLDWIYGAAAAGGTAGFFGVWNTYNRVNVASLSLETTSTWTYSTVAIRPANGSTNMRASFVSGLAEDVFGAVFVETGQQIASNAASVGVGYDSTTAYSGLVGIIQNSLATTVTANYKTTSIGFHFFQGLEWVQGGTMTALGTLNTAQTGLLFEGRM